jgi:hypothetical protein
MYQVNYVKGILPKSQLRMMSGSQNLPCLNSFKTEVFAKCISLQTSHMWVRSGCSVQLTCELGVSQEWLLSAAKLQITFGSVEWLLIFVYRNFMFCIDTAYRYSS